jgi:hypothetical protein
MYECLYYCILWVLRSLMRKYGFGVPTFHRPLSQFQIHLSQDLADAVDRAEWQEQSKSNKPAAKKMPKPKKMPESLRPGPRTVRGQIIKMRAAFRPQSLEASLSGLRWFEI